MDTEFGHMIRARRKELGYTQRELTDLIRIRQATVSDVERGRPPDFKTLLGLARALHCRIVFGPDGVTLERC